mmetsp:Transcript_36209/g.32552  ORF Transcript_36209/g.32552 Transcript_36209/m.32552 type:complete len:85 (-) Transcript_36209:326-580(-)
MDGIYNYTTDPNDEEEKSPLAELILESNKIAMDHLRNENFGAALDLLRKAESILLREYQMNPNETCYRLIGITLNNLGCYYKRT